MEVTVRRVQRRDIMRGMAAGMAGVVGGQALGGVGAASAGAAGGRGSAGVLGRLGLVYLSHDNDPATTTLFPGDPPFELEVMATVPVDGFYMQYVREGEHTGTHWGAPAHFQEGGTAATTATPGSAASASIFVWYAPTTRALDR